MSYDKIMIIAHPDDEMIFGGAQLIQEKGWLVICVTNAGHKERRKEFKKAMNKVQAQYKIWDYKDKWGGGFDSKRLKRDLAKVLVRQPVEKVVTHNLEGEYGHTQHIALSKIVHELIDKNMYVFEISENKLDEKVLKKKKKILKYYKSQDMKWLKRYIQYESLKQVR